MQDQFPVVDWPYWAQCPAWTLEEAVSLMLGFHPAKAVYPEDCLSPEEAVSFRRLAARVQRAMDSGELKGPLVAPADYLKWAKRRGITVVPELRKAVEEAMSTPTPIVEGAHPAFRPESVGTLVVGMAEEFAEYDAERPNSAPRKICARLRARGLIISEDTIRDILRYYSEYVKRGGTPD